MSRRASLHAFAEEMADYQVPQEVMSRLAEDFAAMISRHGISALGSRGGHRYFNSANYTMAQRTFIQAVVDALTYELVCKAPTKTWQDQAGA